MYSEEKLKTQTRPTTKLFQAHGKDQKKTAQLPIRGGWAVLHSNSGDATFCPNERDATFHSDKKLRPRLQMEVFKV